MNNTVIRGFISAVMAKWILQIAFKASNLAVHSANLFSSLTAEGDTADICNSDVCVITE